MKSYGLTLKGKLYVEKILTLTPWSSNDEGRVVYVENEDKFYFGTDSEWIEGGGVGSSVSNTAGVSTSSGSDGTGGDTGSTGTINKTTHLRTPAISYGMI